MPRARRRTRAARRREDRRTGTEKDLELVEARWVDTCGDTDGQIMVDALRACVARLTDRHRRVLQLFYGTGISRRDIAARMRMRETGVKTMLQRLREQLRSCVERRLRSSGDHHAKND